MKFSFFPCFVILVMIDLFAVSCKKQGDENPPEINISSPKENSTYNFNDSIPVTVIISDDENIKSVRVSLVTINLQPQSGSVYYYPDTKFVSYNFDFIINNSFLESGVYYLQITASDGMNTTNAFVQIQINGQPYIFEGLIYLTKPSTIQVHLLNTQMSTNFLFETSGDYIESVVMSKYRKLFIAGNDFLNLEVYNIDDFQLEWMLEPDIYTPYHLKDCLFADNDLYISFGKNYFRRYLAEGLLSFTTEVGEMESPGNIKRIGGYVIVERQGMGLFDSYIGCYYQGTGSLFNEAQIYYEIDFMTEGGEGEVVLVCSDFNGNSIKVFNIVEGKVFDAFTLPSGSISFCENLNDDIFLCGIGQDVYEISYSNKFYLKIPQLTGIRIARFEKTGQKLYSNSENRIFIFNYPDYSLLQTIIVENDVLNIHLLYNR